MSPIIIGKILGWLATLCVAVLLVKMIEMGRDDFRQRALRHGSRAPDRATRIVETFVYTMLALGLFWLIAVNRSTGGMLFSLEGLPPENRAMFLWVFMGTLSGVVLSAMLAYSGRTPLAVATGTFVTLLFGAALNYGTLNWRERRLNELRETGINSVTLTVTGEQGGTGFDYDGAVIHFPGNEFGTSPLKMSAEKLQRLESMQKGEPPPQKTLDHVIYDSPFEMSYRSANTWHTFNLPVRSFGPREDHGDFVLWTELDGETGAWTKSLRGSGPHRDPVYQVEAIFPERDRRVQELIRWAAAADGVVDGGWFAELENYGSQGKLALSKAEERLPKLAAQSLGRTASRYGAADDLTPEKAWALFENVMNEADRAQAYDTASSVGQFVAFIAPRLDPERLVGLGEALIPKYRRLAVGWELKNERLDFGYPEIAGASPLGNRIKPRFESVEFRGAGGQAFPPRAFAVAHAVWLLNLRLKAEGAAEPNIVQSRIAPQLLCWQSDKEVAMRAAAAIGGPAVGKFLIRQNWQRKVDFTMRRDAIVTNGAAINVWAYLLLNVNDKTGRSFRDGHSQMAFEIADILSSHANEPPAFLFLDRDQGPQSLAMQYWPKYLANLQEAKFYGSVWKMKYLTRMGQHLDADTMIDAWRGIFAEMETRQISPNLSLEELNALPREKRMEVLARLHELAAERLAELGPARNGLSRHPYDWLERDAESRLIELGEEGALRRAIERVTASGNRNVMEDRKALAGWLADGHQDHPLIAMLASAEEAELRMMAVEVLKSWPMEKNRRMLEQLAMDEDAGVRSEAVRALEEIQELIDAKPEELAAR